MNNITNNEYGDCVYMCHLVGMSTLRFQCSHIYHYCTFRGRFGIVRKSIDVYNIDVCKHDTYITFRIW